MAIAAQASSATELSFAIDRRGKLTLIDRKSGSLIANDTPGLPNSHAIDYCRHLALDYVVFCMRLGRIKKDSLFLIKTDLLHPLSR